MFELRRLETNNGEFFYQEEYLMFYEVRVMDRNGRLRKVVSAKQLSRMYWQHFQKEETSRTTSGRAQNKIRREVRKRLAEEYPDFWEVDRDYH